MSKKLNKRKRRNMSLMKGGGEKRELILFFKMSTKYNS